MTQGESVLFHHRDRPRAAPRRVHTSYTRTSPRGKSGSPKDPFLRVRDEGLGEGCRTRVGEEWSRRLREGHPRCLPSLLKEGRSSSSNNSTPPHPTPPPPVSTEDPLSTPPPPILLRMYRGSGLGPWVTKEVRGLGHGTVLGGRSGAHWRFTPH